MKSLRQKALRAVLPMMCLLLVGWLIVDVPYRKPSRNAMQINSEMKTVCVGRFLIDLPADAVVSFGSTEVDGFEISHFGAESAPDPASRFARQEQVATNTQGEK